MKSAKLRLRIHELFFFAVWLLGLGSRNRRRKGVNGLGERVIE